MNRTVVHVCIDYFRNLILFLLFFFLLAKGVYFAKNAKYSIDYCTSNADINNGLYCMVACRVLIGDIAQGKRNCDSPLKSDGNTRYETLVNDIKKPKIFVATRDYVALPVYYIWFKKISLDASLNSNYKTKMNATISSRTMTPSYRVGSKIDCLDRKVYKNREPNWYHATVIDINNRSNKLLIKYDRFGDEYNEWIHCESKRLAPRDSHTKPKTKTKTKTKTDWSSNGKVSIYTLVEDGTKWEEKGMNGHLKLSTKDDTIKMEWCTKTKQLLWYVNVRRHGKLLPQDTKTWIVKAKVCRFFFVCLLVLP